MSLVYRETGKGIWLAEQGADEAAMQRALERLDDRLILAWEVDPIYSSRVYKVVRRVSDDRPAVHICDWRDDYGKPLPLSSGLTDLVQSLRPGARGAGLGMDEHNARLAAKRKDEADAMVDSIAHDYRKKLSGAPDPHHIQGAVYKSRRFGAGA